jgi:hypothetical protein
MSDTNTAHGAPRRRRGSRPTPSTPRATRGARQARQKPHRASCDRCRAAGVHRRPARTITPYWDPAMRLCPTCAKALAHRFDATDTWPPPGPSVASRNPTRRIA